MLHTKIGLQFFQLDAESWLGDVADLRCPAEVTLLDQCDQILKRPQVHFLTHPIDHFGSEEIQASYTAEPATYICP